MSSRSASNSLSYIRTLFLLCCSAFLLTSCSWDDEDTPAEPEFPTQAADQLTPGVHWQINGQLQQQTIDTQLTGPGIFRHIPQHNNRPAYYYIGDGVDNDDFSLSIIIPGDSLSGVYGLRSTAPFNTGKIFEAKLESKQYGHFNLKTQGFVTLNQLQIDSQGHVLSSGTFAFRSENDAGEALEVIGSFNFDGPEN